MKLYNKYVCFLVVWGSIFWVGEVFADSFQIQPFPVAYPNEDLIGPYMFYWEEVGDNSPDEVLKKFLNGEFTSFEMRRDKDKLAVHM